METKQLAELEAALKSDTSAESIYQILSCNKSRPINLHNLLLKYISEDERDISFEDLIWHCKHLQRWDIC